MKQVADLRAIEAGLSFYCSPGSLTASFGKGFVFGLVEDNSNFGKASATLQYGIRILEDTGHSYTFQGSSFSAHTITFKLGSLLEDKPLIETYNILDVLSNVGFIKAN